MKIISIFCAFCRGARASAPPQFLVCGETFDDQVLVRLSWFVGGNGVGKELNSIFTCEADFIVSYHTVFW